MEPTCRQTRDERVPDQESRGTDYARERPGDDRRLADLLSHRRAVAVGEVELDFHYDFAPREAQERALSEQ
jgi:Tat protein secretion system quality control protein TatD with DNase activity